jgi:hypothetical protein
MQAHAHTHTTAAIRPCRDALRDLGAEGAAVAQSTSDAELHVCVSSMEDVVCIRRSYLLRRMGQSGVDPFRWERGGVGAAGAMVLI